MTVIAKRFVVRDLGATPYIAVQGLQGIVALAGPIAATHPVPYTAGDPAPPQNKYYDAVLEPTGTDPSQPIHYHALMNDDGTFTVLVDLFNPGDITHTYAGWPIPGYPYP